MRRHASSLFSRPFLPYIRRQDPKPLGLGYLILSKVEGEPLHVTWGKYRHGAQFRANLFRHLCRISLSMNRIALPRIGSPTIDSQGLVTLANRPLSLYFHMYCNEGVPSGIPRERTYGSIEPCIFDLLRGKENMPGFDKFWPYRAPNAKEMIGKKIRD